MELHHFDHAAFLRDTWQKKPLLIRQAWTQWRNPLEPDELANSDPLGKGWFFKIRVGDKAEFDALMDEPDYAKFSAEG